VPVPLKGAEGKVLYVWFDAPIGYISATKELLPDTWEKYWKDTDTRLIHFIGKDNIVFHCIIFPCMLKAAGDFILPENVPANEFLNLEGAKISTSRNHAVWLHEYLQDFPGRNDELRYVLTSISPETKDADFTWKDYQQKVNSELVAILGNFVNRVMVLSHKYYEGVVPAAIIPEAVTPERNKVIADYLQAEKEINQAISEMIKALDEFRFREAQFQLMNIARAGNRFLADTEPWKLIKQDAEAVAWIMNRAINIVANLGLAAEPFLPQTAKAVNKQLNTNESENDSKKFWHEAAMIEVISANHQLGQAALLYRNIEDEEIEKQIHKLRKTETKVQVKEMNSENTTAAPKAEITYDDFAKLDIRIGKVLQAERMEKSNKLLKLTIDIGIEQRTILSGIAKQFTPEEIIGKQVTVLINLAPRKMMGIESQGMVLMAEDAAGNFRLINPHEEVEPGSAVS
jgi:methionyl-tRNA synthetase